jgi:pimeloyl-ACP methyl ester carboxylesterase
MEKNSTGKLDNFYAAQKVPFAVKALRLYFSKMGWLFPDYSAKLFWTMFTSPKKRTLKERHINFLNSALERNSFFIESKEYITYTWGNGPKTVILMHGWEGMAADWQLLIEELKNDSSLKIIAIDFPAHGNAGGNLSNMAYFIKGLTYIIEKNGPVYAIIGHSLGANSAFFALEKMRENAKVEHLIMLGSYPIPFHFFETFQRFMKISPKLFNGISARIFKKLGIDVRQLNMYEQYQNIHADNILLIHDVHDEVADMAKVDALKKEWKQANIFSGEHGGHYRHFRNKDVISKIKMTLLVEVAENV